MDLGESPASLEKRVANLEKQAQDWLTLKDIENLMAEWNDTMRPLDVPPHP